MNIVLLTYLRHDFFFMNKKDKPVILVTNDDGITAPGLHALMQTMMELGGGDQQQLDSPQSAWVMPRACTICQVYRQSGNTQRHLWMAMFRHTC